MVQIFTAMVAYNVLMMIQSLLSWRMGIPDMIRRARHGISLPLRINEAGTVSVKV